MNEEFAAVHGWLIGQIRLMRPIGLIWLEQILYFILDSVLSLLLILGRLVFNHSVKET